MRFLLVLLVLLLVGCGSEQPAPAAKIPVPIDGSASEPRFASGLDGHLYLSWTEKTETGHRLRVARYGDGWEDAVTVAEGDDWFVNWADFPALAVLADGTMAASWLVRSADGTYTYDVHASVSRDAGATWSDPVKVNDDDVAAEHGFVTLVPAGERFFVTWLDGRNTAGGHDEGAGDGHGGGGAMTLRAGYLSRDGAMEDRRELDDRVCDCCNTAAVVLGDDVVVAYRDRSPAEIRDISRVRYDSGNWSDPAPVHEDGWVIPGCPVNGPALAAHGDRVLCAWFTAPMIVDDEPDPAAFAALSTDRGATFGEPVRLDGRVTEGRVDAVAVPEGGFVVGWMEQGDEGARYLVCRIDDDGTRGAAKELFATALSRSSGFPRLAVHDGRLFAAWTVPGEETSSIASESFPLP